jgi:hypothetical protein
VLHPAGEGGVIDREAPLGHQLFAVAGALAHPAGPSTHPAEEGQPQNDAI